MDVNRKMRCIYHILFSCVYSSLCLPCETNPGDCADQGNRRDSDEQPLEYVKRHSGYCGFGMAVIPIQVRTV